MSSQPIDPRDFRELLVADLALLTGIASARDVAAALQRFWDDGQRRTSSFGDELAHVARIPREDLLSAEVEADRLISDAGGNAKAALSRRGGLDRTIHVALSQQGSHVSRALSEVGASLRAPLRPLPSDRYTDFEVAGEGGMGVVYAALDTELNRVVAFKMVRPEARPAGSDTPAIPFHVPTPEPDTPQAKTFEGLRTRFLQEAWVTGGLEHPGIVPVYELGETPAGIPYYTMRFVRGRRSLEDAIDETHRSDETDRLRLLEPFLRLCDTVAYAHSRNVIHRDIKPENVALGEYGEVVLLDWGLAKLAEREDLAASRWQERVQDLRETGDLRTVAGALGTPGYMSPEAALGVLDQVDARSDIYSLGAVLFRILTGRHPFSFSTYAEFIDLLRNHDPPDAATVDSAVPRELSSICAKAMSRSPGDRHGSATELAESIRSWERESATFKEVRALMREADAALEGTKGLEGQALLQQVDRVVGIGARVLDLRPTHRRTRMLLEQAQRIRQGALKEREKAVREREVAQRRRVLRRVGMAAVLVVGLGVGVAGFLLDVERQDLYEAQRLARAEGHSAREQEERAGRAERREQSERTLKTRALERHEAERRARTAAETLVESTQRERAEAVARLTAEVERRAELEGRANTASAAAERERARAEQLSQELERAREDRDRLRRELTEEEAATRKAADAIRRMRPSSALSLVEASRSLRTVDPVLAVMLAREATRRDPSSASVTGLRNALRPFRGWTWRGGGGLDALAVAHSVSAAKFLVERRGYAPQVVDPTGHELAVLVTRGRHVRKALFSPDGSRLLAHLDDGGLRMWDQEGRRVAVLRTRIRDWCGAYLADGTRFVLLPEADPAELWGSDGVKVGELGIATKGARCIAVASGDRRLLVGYEEGHAHLYELDGELAATLPGSGAAVTGVAISPRGRRLLTSSDGGPTRVWDAEGKVSVELEEPLPAGEGFAFSDDEARVLAVARDGSVRVWAVDGRVVSTLRAGTADIAWASFSANGTQIDAVCRDGSTYTLGTHDTERTVFPDHPDELDRVVGYPGRDLTLTSSRDGRLRVWHPGRPAVVLGQAGQWAGDTGFLTPDVVYALSSDARAWSWADGKAELAVRHRAPITSATSTHRPPRLLTASEDGTARIWHLETRRTTGVASHAGAVLCASFSADGERVVTGSLDTDATLWDTEGRKLRVFSGHDTPVRHALISPTGELVLTASEHSVRLWNEEGEQVAHVRDHPGEIVACAFVAAGTRFLTASTDSTARIWELDGTLRSELRGHEEAITSVDVANAGTLIVTSSGDGTARLWNDEGKELSVLTGHRGAVNRAVFHDAGAMGLRVLTASDDGTARRWPAQTDELLRLADHLVARDFTAEERAAYPALLVEEDPPR